MDPGATRSATPYNFAWNIGNTSNNNSCSAQGVSLGAVVQDIPEADTTVIINGIPTPQGEDWFYFDVGSSSTIVITAANFTATGQYNIVRQTGDCSQFTWPPLLVQNATSNLTTMTLFNQPAGRYFFRVATTGNFNSTPYTFRVTSTTGGTEAAVDYCPAFQGCVGNVSTGGTLTVYWRGMTGASFLRIAFRAWGLDGCSPGNPG